ncbi:MAG: hypothetical protein K2J07_06820, partial [Muribaculaceae bacterium]|nr:hypothetical protein [Muribaculaceae bacterium]
TWTLEAIVDVLAILSGVVMEKSGKTANGPAFDKGTVTNTTTTTSNDLPSEVLPTSTTEAN